MSVQTEIDRISTAVQNAHLKVIAKGGTSAAPYLVANLPDAIDTIPEATEPKLQAKSATPSETAQTVKPDSGYDGLSQVSVGAISKTYVGSGVTKQAAKTITPSTSSQTAVAKGVYTTGAVTVGAIPSTYVKPTATKAATTYTPSTSNQTIAAGTYCSGAQTIKGDRNLVAGNIKSGVSIFGVAGTMTAGEDVTAETNTYTDLLDDLEAAVDALPNAGSGGELQIATGTFRPTIADMSEANVVISGLAFQPKYITIALANNLTTPPTVGSNGFAAMQYYVTNLCYTETETAGQHIYRSSASAAAAIINSDKISRITLTPTADGFTITGSRIYWFTLNYQYIAVG